MGTLSDKFTKYSSIENHYQEGFLARCPQQDLLWGVTEKIHGANFQVYVDNENFLIGSRNRWLHENDNFHGLQKIIEGYKDDIMWLKNRICRDTKSLTLYGEVYGDNVQKEVKYSKTTKIRFFDIKRDNQYAPYISAAAAFEEAELPYVSIIHTYIGNVLNLVNDFDTRFNTTFAEGEYRELEDNICEGVVIRPLGGDFFTPLGDRVLIKKKNEEFFEKRKIPKSKPDRFVDYSKDLELVEPYINENRFNSVFSKDVYEKKDFGNFIKAYMQDVVEDAAKDGIEFTNIKNINNIVARETKEDYFRRVA